MTLDPKTLRIRDLMTNTPTTIGGDQTLAAARKRMREAKIRHLPVLHGGELIGLLSSRDIDLVESLAGLDIEEVVVAEAMSRDPYTVGPEASLREVAQTMAERKLGTAIVTDNDHVVGIFTTVDALDALSSLLEEQRTATISRT